MFTKFHRDSFKFIVPLAPEQIEAQHEFLVLQPGGEYWYASCAAPGGHSERPCPAGRRRVKYFDDTTEDVPLVPVCVFVAGHPDGLLFPTFVQNDSEVQAHTQQRQPSADGFATG